MDLTPHSQQAVLLNVCWRHLYLDRRRLTRPCNSIHATESLSTHSVCASQLVIIEAGLINGAGNCQWFSQRRRQIEWHCQAGIGIIHSHAPPILLRCIWVWIFHLWEITGWMLKKDLRVRRFAGEGVIFRVLGIKERAASLAMQVIVIPGWRETHQFRISSLLWRIQLRMCACRAAKWGLVCALLLRSSKVNE